MIANITITLCVKHFCECLAFFNYRILTLLLPPLTIPPPKNKQRGMYFTKEKTEAQKN